MISSRDLTKDLEISSNSPIQLESAPIEPNDSTELQPSSTSSSAQQR
jgi:hypothetical protein